jgi:hypothetical protein
MSLSGVSSSKITTASTMDKAASNNAESWSLIGRLSPFSLLTEPSEFNPITKTSPSLAAVKVK